MENQIEIYKSIDNAIELQVNLVNDTLWLNRNQLAMLFNRDIKIIGKHINNLFLEEVLPKKSVVANFATTAIDGKIRQVDYHNLNIIISVGYRVKPKQRTQFSQCAILINYLIHFKLAA